MFEPECYKDEDKVGITMQTEQELPFLKRDPMIFLVGDMESSGFVVVKKPYDRDVYVDTHGVTWYKAVIAACNMMFTHDPCPISLSALWIGDKLYQTEHAIHTVEFGKQGYYEFQKLTRDAEKDDADSVKLFTRFKPITKYRIPEPETYAREIFTCFTKDLWKDLERRTKTRAEIEDKLREVQRLIRTF